jgi:hypothetical protein
MNTPCPGNVAEIYVGFPQETVSPWLDVERAVALGIDKP